MKMGGEQTERLKIIGNVISDSVGETVAIMGGGASAEFVHDQKRVFACEIQHV